MPMPPAKIHAIAPNNSGSIGSITVVVQAAAKPREKYAEGTIGRDALKRNYIAYLQGRYYEWRKKDVGFPGVDRAKHDDQIARLYVTENAVIRKKFGANPFGLLAISFEPLVEHLQERIDRTRFGRTNKAKGYRNYHSFDEHCLLGASGPGA